MFLCCSSSAATKAEIIQQSESDKKLFARLKSLSKIHSMPLRLDEIAEIACAKDLIFQKAWENLSSKELKKAKKALTPIVKRINNIFRSIYSEENLDVFKKLKQAIDTFVNQHETYSGIHLARVQNISIKRKRIESEIKDPHATLESKVVLVTPKLKVASELLNEMLDIAAEIDEVEMLLLEEAVTRTKEPFDKRKREEQIGTLKSTITMLQAHKNVYGQSSCNRQIENEIQKTEQLIKTNTNIVELEQQAKVLSDLIRDVVTMPTIKVAQSRAPLDDSIFADPNAVCSDRSSKSPIVDDEETNEEVSSKGLSSPTKVVKTPDVPEVSPKGRFSMLSKKNYMSSPSICDNPFARAISTPTVTDTLASSREISSPSPPPPIPFHRPSIKPLEFPPTERPKGPQSDIVNLPNMLMFDNEYAITLTAKAPSDVKGARRIYHYSTAE